MYTIPYTKSSLEILWVILSLFITTRSKGQDTLPTQFIQEILMTENRLKLDFPWTYDRDTIKDIDVFQASLRHTFDRQVGIQSFNGENFAQDIRISIRGFGSRSAFGIRGIRIYQDGIPLTSPDGTTQLDEISGLDIQSFDLLRSGLAARLGNSAGGAISLKTTDYLKGGFFLGQVNQYGSINSGLKYGFINAHWAHLTSMNHHKFYGKRDFSESQNTTFYNKLRYFISDKWQIEWLTGLYYSPTGTDPGALNTSEITINKYAANNRNKDFSAGEYVKGWMTAFTSKYFINPYNTFQSNIFYRKRDFEARLPFESGGWVDLNRNFVGTNQTYLYRGIKNINFSLGSSLEYQKDQRQLYHNLKGIKGQTTSHQLEEVFNFSLFQEIKWSFSKWGVHQLLRWDFNQYNLTDLFKEDGIENGSQSFDNINGALGLEYKINIQNQIFGNFSTSFEMPSLNELSNNPFGAGFNPQLSPEKSWQIELGHRWKLNGNLDVQSSLFYIHLSDQIVSYELSESPGRNYYRNAASSDRKGLEVSAKYTPKPKWHFDINYTWSDFRYITFISAKNNYSNNKQTLIPEHKIHLNTTFPVLKWMNLQLSLAYSSSLWLDDANSHKANGYGECNFMIITTDNLLKTLQIGISGNNLFNLMTYSNFRVNAAAMRYYEVATPMHFGLFGKLKI